MRFKSLAEQNNFIEVLRTATIAALKEWGRHATRPLAVVVRHTLKWLHASWAFQILLTVVILGNFVNFILVAEMKPPDPSRARNILETMDFAFTIAFLVGSISRSFFLA